MVDVLERESVLKSKGILEGDPINVSVSDQIAYRKDLNAIVSEMSNETEGLITDFYDRNLMKQDANEGTVALAVILLALLKERLDAIVERNARDMAVRMAGRLTRTGRGMVGRSLGKVYGKFVETQITDELRAKVQAIVLENIRLIKSIEEQYLSQIEGALMRSIIDGGPKKDLIAVLAKQKGISKRRAKNTAIDQVHKAYVHITTELMSEAGIDKFEWVYTYRSKTRRDDHVAMNGNIYSINQPPVIDRKTGKRGLPGDIYNCKCAMRPVLKS